MIQRMSGKSKKGQALTVTQHNDPSTHEASSEDQPVFVVMEGRNTLVQTLDWKVAFRTFQINRG